jgi:hypothetical protein
MSNFGPWVRDISPAERLARLRSMRALALVHCRSHRESINTLHMAETLADALPRAFDQLECLPALRRRHLLAAYSQLIGRPR